VPPAHPAALPGPITPFEVVDQPRGWLVDVAGWRTFRQVSLVEIYESQITVGLVVRARLPFRVFTLDGPGQRSQLAIDVAHRW